jgi:hypothetical protein
MGARESRSQQEADDDGTTPQDSDYYTILEVDENASADEIRVSFLSPIRGREKGRGGSCFAVNVDYDDRFFVRSVRSDVSRSSIIPTRTMRTQKARRDASPHCSKRMRYALFCYHFYVSKAHGNGVESSPLVQPKLL